MKKIAFLISDQHLIPHGGIGSFCKSFSEMVKESNNELHIVVDKKPSNNFAYDLTDLENVFVKYNDKPLSYATHQKIFMYGESVNYEKIINFQQVILELLEVHTYDYIVVNSQEAFAAIATLDTKTKVILYTHLYKQIYPDANVHDVFLPAYHNFFGIFLKVDHMIVGTQSERNKKKLLENGSIHVEVLPMPMSERTLLTENFEERSGVLFIGRWEAGKNPEAYIKVMKETGLPCKVMTNANGAKKFEKAFSDAGITDYEIRTGITGKEKSDFIKSCQVSFNCSLIENYPFAFVECVGHMPVVVLDKQDWSDNFDLNFFVKTSVTNASKAIKEAYAIDINSRYSQGSLEYVKQLDKKAKASWLKY